MANSDVDGGASSDYWREGNAYTSDLRDAEWARLEPLIPKALPGGLPRKADMRAAMNAIPYLLRTGCSWRYLPRDSLPPRSTVYNIFRKFQCDGVWEAIWAKLHMALRQGMGREASPSAAVLDSQSVTGWQCTMTKVRKRVVKGPSPDRAATTGLRRKRTASAGSPHRRLRLMCSRRPRVPALRPVLDWPLRPEVR
jgi:transposase